LLKIRGFIQQLAAFVRAENGARDSLSQRERAGVRENATFVITATL
jgi:hypothetical protein